MAKSLAELASALGSTPEPGWAQIEIGGICEDTRRLIPGDLFAAVSGHNRNGSEFIAQAINGGAVAVLSERSMDLSVPVLKVPCVRKALAQLSDVFYDHPTCNLFTVGVTGTNGKTTTCHWAADLLRQCETMLLSTVRNPILGIPGLTTPPSAIIQRLAQDALNNGAQNLIIEASSAGIAQNRVSSIDFDACVFTNFSPEHLNHHRGLTAYRGAKLKLFENMKPDAWAILNADDPMHAAIAATTPAHVLTYGINAEADIHAGEIHCKARSSRFTVAAAQEEDESVFLPIPGRHNISNALAAIGVGIVKGISLSVLAERLTQASAPIPGRAEFFRRADGLVAVVDFAHNPSSLEVILKSLRPKYSRIIVVFGCPGDGEHEKRANMGEVSGRLADAVVLTTDNPKNEDPGAIADEIRIGIGSSLVPVTIVLDRKQAIHAAVSQAKTGDVILLAGKGHETEQLIEGARIPHSDAEVLRECEFAADTGIADD